MSVCGECSSLSLLEALTELCISFSPPTLLLQAEFTSCHQSIQVERSKEYHSVNRRNNSLKSCITINLHLISKDADTMYIYKNITHFPPRPYKCSTITIGKENRREAPSHTRCTLLHQTTMLNTTRKKHPNAKTPSYASITGRNTLRCDLIPIRSCDQSTPSHPSSHFEGNQDVTTRNYTIQYNADRDSPTWLPPRVTCRPEGCMSTLRHS